METNRDQLKRHAGGLAGLLVRCGMGGTAATWVANIAIGVAVAALMTVGLLTINGCSASIATPAGWSFRGVIITPAERSK